jgi:lipopolysaccharide export system protein LptA
MLPYLTPPAPPPIIQSVDLDQVSNDRFATDLAQNFSPNSSPTEESSPTIPNSRVETIPPVVEFYFSDPQQIPNSSLPSPPSTTDDRADVLGSPISIEDSTSINPNPVTSTPQAATVANEVIFGLNQNLGTKPLSQLLVIEERQGKKRQFKFSDQGDFHLVQTPSNLQQFLQDGSSNPEETESIVELIADQQEYDSVREIVTARGNVVMRLSNGVLTADRLQVNLPKRLAVAEGNVVLTRGDQVIRGERFEYYFVEDSGIVYNANGEIYQSTTSRDFSPNLASDVSAGTISYLSLSDRLALDQPLQRVTTAGGYSFVFGTQKIGGPEGGNFSGGGQGEVNRFRFEATQLEFEGASWDATDIRLSNDPFSPPELEVRAEQAHFRQVEPLVDEITLTNSRVVFDQRVSVPTQDRLVFDKRDRRPTLFNFGYDGEDRGGLYVERGFQIIDTPEISFQITPQYLIQKALFPDAFPESNPNNNDVGPLTPAVFGLVADFYVTFSERTSLLAIASFSSLNLDDIPDHLRSKLRVQEKVGNIDNPYRLNFEYNYRERLFNGSLGFQTVESSVGFLITSPTITLGNTGINFTYQGSIQSVEASTDRQDLLPPNPQDNLVTLFRTQGAASLSRGFLLWYGEALPATPEQGLRYTPTPVMPFIQLNTGLTGVFSYYSSGDIQPSLTGSIGISGQFGHFSRSYLDYTGFNITYSQGLRGDPSPFYFDRFNDTQTISFGITQQIYGPVRFGFQTAYSFNENKEISTDYILEWSRRTYSILLRYNPVLELGSINLRISDFNWSGNPGLFEGTSIRPVIDGVVR